MWRFLINLFAIVGLIAALVGGAIGFTAWRFVADFDAVEPVADDSVLLVDLSRLL